MGVRCSVSCLSCGFEQHFVVGVGMGSHSLETAIDKMHYRRRPKVLALLNEHSVHETDYEHRVYRCNRCGRLRNAFWAKIVYDDDQVFETKFQCGSCYKPMANISEHHQLNDQSCPCCGRKKLHVVDDFLRD